MQIFHYHLWITRIKCATSTLEWKVDIFQNFKKIGSKTSLYQVITISDSFQHKTLPYTNLRSFRRRLSWGRRTRRQSGRRSDRVAILGRRRRGGHDFWGNFRWKFLNFHNYSKKYSFRREKIAKFANFSMEINVQKSDSFSRVYAKTQKFIWSTKNEGLLSNNKPLIGCCPGLLTAEWISLSETRGKLERNEGRGMQKPRHKGAGQEKCTDSPWVKTRYFWINIKNFILIQFETFQQNTIREKKLAWKWCKNFQQQKLSWDNNLFVNKLSK